MLYTFTDYGTILLKDFRTVRLKDIYGAMLTDRQRDVIEQYYEFDLSLGEIAENLSVTRQAVHCALRQAEALLENCEDKLGFVRKFDELEKAVDECFAFAESGDMKKKLAQISEILRS